MGPTEIKYYFHVHCSLHGCDLVENEHYDNWFLEPDFSGFFCPKNLTGRKQQEDYVDCSEYWKVSPVGWDHIDIFELCETYKKEHK